MNLSFDNLPPELLCHIGFFANPHSLVAFTSINGKMSGLAELIFNEKYKKTFGTINDIQVKDRPIVSRLLSYAEEQPDPAINHNIHKRNLSFSKHWKWLVGVENSLDNEVMENYSRSFTLLNNTQAISILQLKNQMVGFWHINRQIKDYTQWRSGEIAQAKSSLASNLMFASISLPLRSLYRTPPPLNIESLDSLSRKKFAKIGSFDLDEHGYVVAAFHLFADEDTPISGGAKRFRYTTGRTLIGIFKKEETPNFKSLGHKGHIPASS